MIGRSAGVRAMIVAATMAVFLPVVGRASKPSPPAGVETVLTNGMRVLIASTGESAPVATLELMVGMGEKDGELAGIVALASFGSDLPDGESFARALARNGVVSELSVGRVRTSLRLVFPADRLRPVLSLVGEHLLRAAPSPTDWARAVADWRQTKAFRSREIEYLLPRALHSRLWRDGEAATPGEPAPGATRPSPEVLESFRNAHYRPANMVVGLIAGLGLPQASIEEELDAALGRWQPEASPAPEETSTVADAASPGIGENERSRPGPCLYLPSATVPTLSVGYALAGVSPQDEIAWRALAHILGGSSGSRLNRILRVENEWAYTVEAALTPAGHGRFDLAITTRTPELREVYEAITGAMRRLASEAVSAAELRRAEAVLLSRERLTHESPLDWIRWHGARLLEGGAGAGSAWDRISERIEGLTVAGLQEVARRYLSALRPVSVVISDGTAWPCHRSASVTASGSGAATPRAPGVPLGYPPVPVPPGESMTPRAAALGRDLFFDRRLSSDGTVSCSSCHRPEASFADTESVSAGVNGRTSSRNAPSLWNVAYAPNLFWDGRVETLEHQVLYPVTHPNEMNMRDRDVADLVAGDPRYASRFAKAFGTREVTFGHVSQAIAAYERTLVSGDAAFDAFYFCEEDEAISPAARRGWELFRTRGCIGCHQFDRRNPFFTDFDFHNTGVGWDRQTVDLGRYRLTRDRDDRGKFRTPSLRDVARTAPYMHDGRFRRLEEVLDFYNAGGFPNRYLDERIAPLGLTETEKADMVAFLRSLSHGTAPLAPSCNFGARNVEGEE